MREFLNPGVVASFWQRVDKRGPDDCWEWQSSLSEWGYGRLWLSKGRKKYLPAHRVAYVLAYGEVPPDKPFHPAVARRKERAELRALAEQQQAADDPADDPAGGETASEVPQS